MIGILVERSGVDWPAWVQAIGSVVAIGVSIWLGIWLPGRDRKRHQADELRNQVIAVSAIAKRSVRMLERLDERAQKGSFTKDALGWLMTEMEATVATVGAIDLMAIRSPALIGHVAELQEAVRTGLRRFNWAANHIRKGELTKSDEFSEPLARANKAMAGLSAMQVT